MLGNPSRYINLLFIMASSKRTEDKDTLSSVTAELGQSPKKRGRASVEIDAEIHARYKELVEGRKLVDVTTALIELFLEDRATQNKVLRRLGQKALRRPPL